MRWRPPSATAHFPFVSQLMTAAQRHTLPPARRPSPTGVEAIKRCPPLPMWAHFATTPARYEDICSSDDDVPK